MKKIFTMFAALLMAAVALNAKTFYLAPNANWMQADAKFAVYYFNDESDNGWSSYMTEAATGIYSADVPEGYENLIFVRMNPAGVAPSWDGKWNQTGDLTVPAEDDLYTLSADCWDCDGTWSVYDGTSQPGGGGGGDPQPGGGAKDYYLKGYCNGADIEQPTYDELFEHGKLEYSFTETGYFFVLVCDPGQKIGVEYMPATYTEGLTHITLVKQGGQKFPVNEGAGGSVMFYLYDNEDGTYELSIEELPGKKLVDSEEDEPGENALNEVQAVDSESPMYNLLGEKVDASYKGVVIQNGKKFIL